MRNFLQMIVQYAVKIFHRLRVSLLECAPVPTTGHAGEAIRQFRQRIAALGPVPDTDTKATWSAYLRMLRDDCAKKDPRFFLNWPVVRSSMFSEPPPEELDRLQASPHWNMWRTVLGEDRAGYPRPYWKRLSSSGNLIHHAYILNKLFDTYGFLDPKNLQSVFEFGGGYGSLCRLLRRMGYAAPYVIYDLPEFSCLQEYYLQQVGYKTVRGPYAGADRPVVLMSDIGELSREYSAKKPPGLFIAMWSISESPPSIREKIFSTVSDPAYYLIAFQSAFENIDNKSYFEQFAAERPGYAWSLETLGHLPGNYVLLGKRLT